MIDLNEKIMFEREIWGRLKELAEKDDVIGFYKLYIEYLEKTPIISDRRKAIYKMAKRALGMIVSNEGDDSI